MKLRINALIVLIFSAQVNWATDYGYVKDTIERYADVVVYGTIVLADDFDMLIQLRKKEQLVTEATTHLKLISIQPWKYLEDISPHFYSETSYEIWVHSEFYDQIEKERDSYTTKPRFWMIRRNTLLGLDGGELVVRAHDKEFVKLKKSLDEEFSDPLRIRPISQIEKVAESVVAKCLRTPKGDTAIVENGSKYTIWLRVYSGNNLAIKKDPFAHSFEAKKENTGMRGEIGVPEENASISYALQPGEAIRFEIEIPKRDDNERLRLSVVVYPDPDMSDGVSIYSKPLDEGNGE